MEADLLHGGDGGEELRLQTVEALRLIRPLIGGAAEDLQHPVDQVRRQPMIEAKEIPQDLSDTALVRYGSVAIHGEGLLLSLRETVGDSLLVV